jgi:hypothetical protein
MNKTVKKRTVDELVKVSEHLEYEIWMFTSLADCLAMGFVTGGSLANATLEAFIIHFRVLYDFFDSHSRKPNDVIAIHYFDDPIAWRKSKPKSSRLLQESRDRAGKEVVHLSYARLDVKPDERGWNFPKIKEDMLELIRAFFRAVPVDRLGPRCKRRRQQILQESQGKPPIDKNG